MGFSIELDRNCSELKSILATRPDTLDSRASSSAYRLLLHLLLFDTRTRRHIGLPICRLSGRPLARLPAAGASSWRRNPFGRLPIGLGEQNLPTGCHHAYQIGEPQPFLRFSGRHQWLKAGKLRKTAASMGTLWSRIRRST